MLLFRLRPPLAVLALLAAWWVNEPGSRMGPTILVTVAVYLLWAHVRFGPVASAWRAYAAGDEIGAAARLDAVPMDGRLLSRNHRATYHLLGAELALREHGSTEARRHAGLVVTQPTTEHNRAMAHLALARAALIDGDGKAAGVAVARAKGLRFRPNLQKEVDRVAWLVRQADEDAGA